MRCQGGTIRTKMGRLARLTNAASGTLENHRATLALHFAWYNCCRIKWDWQSRLALFVGITAFAFLLSHQIHLRNEAIRTGTAPTQSNSPAAKIDQHAKDSACSNVIGGGDMTIDCPADQKDHGAKKASPKSPQKWHGVHDCRMRIRPDAKR
jgi:hypothetical protein